MAKPLRYFFVGANDKEVEGTFENVDGSDLETGGPLWVAQQPDDYKGAEDCVEVKTTTTGFRLNDLPCHYERFAVCKKSKGEEHHLNLWSPK